MAASRNVKLSICKDIKELFILSCMKIDLEVSDEIAIINCIDWAIEGLCFSFIMYRCTM